MLQSLECLRAAQHAFNPWMKPLKVSANPYRSTSSGTIYLTHEDDHNQEFWWESQQQHHHHHDTQQQQQQREGFVPSYDPEKPYVDPWEEYLQRQEREKRMRKQEEERLYFQYLDDLRAQEHRSHMERESLPPNQMPHDRTEHHGHHHEQHYPQQHPDHHRQDADGSHTERNHQTHHVENTFQRTDQWVDRMIQQHQANAGHWEVSEQRTDQQRPESTVVNPVGDQTSGATNVQHFSNRSTDGGHGGSHANTAAEKIEMVETKTYYPSNREQEPSSTEQQNATENQKTDAGDNLGEVSGLAGALAQLHLGEAKSQEQEAYEEHMRRQCWETGNIDYMGRDSFDNIWKRIQQTLNAGAGQAPEEAVTQAAPVSTTPQRSSRPPSRSRSATPKRDAKDRSPTPQPEEKLPVDKKEAAVVPPPVIAEEDDAAVSVSTTVGSSFAMGRQTKQPPPPIQYDPTTNTTTLTKKVFAGYQQIITTKSPEGKTRTITKLIYDPSVEDDQEQQAPASPITAASDVVDSATVQLPAAAPKPEAPPTPPRVESRAQALSSQDVSSQPTVSKPPSVPAVPSSAPLQQQQQLAQESLAGKTNASLQTQQPVKALRKKRHISPSTQPRQPTAAAPTDRAKGKSSPSPSTAAANRGSAIGTAIPPSAVSPSSAAIASSNRAETIRNHQMRSSNRGASLNATMEASAASPTSPPAETPTPSARQTTPHAAKQAAVGSANTEPAVGQPTPPVPPRRKRESRSGKLGKL
uniref:Uncharacterized protein n=1 Tax=Anopheles dirus TaxID=7168 RepID=A0A182NHA3_9DIPT